MLTPAYAAVLDQVRGITWPARRRARSAVVGPHLSRLLGTSAEFVEYRGYRQGDDTRRIDWKLLARTDRVYIRLAHERTLLPTTFVVDASASLAFPVPALAKWELARQLTVGLAMVARQSGDPVGLMIAYGGAADAGAADAGLPDAGVGAGAGVSASRASAARVGAFRGVAPSARRSVLDEMMRALELVPAGQPSLLGPVRQGMRRAGRVVVISDFLDETDALLALGRTFVASGGELYAIHVVDREELDPGLAARLVEDPEAATVRRPMSAQTRATYQARFGAWRAQLARDWRQAGAVYTMVVTGREPMRQTVRRITQRTAAAATAATEPAGPPGTG